MSDIYAGSQATSTQSWNVVRIPLYNVNAPTGPGEGGTGLFRTPVPFTSMYIHNVGRVCRLYIGEGRQRFIGELPAGTKRSIDLPSPMQEIYVEWDGFEGALLATYNAMQLPYIELWVSDSTIFYAEGFSPGPRVGDVWQPDQGVPWNDTDFQVPNVPATAPITAVIPLIMDSEQNSAGGFTPMIDAENDAPLPRLMPGFVPFTTWEDTTVTNYLVRGNQRAFTESYHVVFIRPNEPYDIGLVMAANTITPVCTLWHLGTDTKAFRLRRVDFALSESSLASDITVFLNSITTQPTGGGIVPIAASRATDVSAVEAKFNPTGGAGFGSALFSMAFYAAGATAAPATLNPPQATRWERLWDDTIGDGFEPIVLTPSGGRGVGIYIDSVAASTLRFNARMWFTEHSPG